MQIEELKELCRGHWHDILLATGIEEEFLTGKHGPCPICGGKDRFRFDDKNGEGTYFCNQCEDQSGDGFKLLQKKFGLNFPDVLNRVKRIIENLRENPISVEDGKKTSNPKIALNKVWTSGVDLKTGGPVSKYLNSRGLTLRPDNVRYVEQCYEPESTHTIPAMISKVINPEGIPVSIHRTYLNISSPGKARIDNPCKLMPGTQPLAGSSIRLFKPGMGIYEPDILGVAEGIETAIAATQLFGVATWSVINAVLMEKWIMPEAYKQVIIFGDNDASFTGQRAAMILASKLTELGVLVIVKIPKNPNTDWNDVVLAKQKEK